jgi:hypothetical protein
MLSTFGEENVFPLEFEVDKKSSRTVDFTKERKLTHDIFSG